MSGGAIADWRLALSLAWRDLRGTGRSFAVLLAALSLGVAIIAAVGILNRGVDTALERDARRLLGGDVELEQVNLPLPEPELQALVPPGSRLTRLVRTTTLARAPSGAGDGGRTVAVNLKAVDDLYPLVGAVQLDPPLPLTEALRDGGAVVEGTLLARLGVAVGDTIWIGDAPVRIAARLVREPDRIGGLFSLGPRVILHHDTLAAAGVVQPGSLVRYEYRIDLPDGLTGPAHVEALKAAHPDAGWRARSPRDIEPQITRLTDRLATFLTLAGLTALLTGGLGIALTIETHLARRTGTIATLKCLGAGGAQVFRIYLGQMLLVAAVGVLLGLALGLLLPLGAYLLPEGSLPIVPELDLHLAPLLRAAVAGLVTTFVFALWPLAIAREVSPASLFRALVAPPRRRPRRPYLVLLALGVLALVLVAVLGVPQPRIGAWFVLTTLAAAGLLWGLTRLVVLAARHLAHHGNFALRLAVANLHRPGSPAPRVIMALGAGATVLAAVALLAANLRQEVEQRLPDQAPALFLIDIQSGQQAELTAVLEEVPGAALAQMLPSLRARVVRIDGRPVEQVPVAPNVAWTVSRDRGLTYAAALPEGSELAAGSWWPADYQGPPLLSLDEEVAEGYGVGLGDTLAFNVLGRTIEARIANLRREVDWSGGRLDFLFILNPAALQAAPHTFVASAHVPPEREAALLDLLAERLPNVTPIALRDVIGRASEILRRIELAVEVVAGLTLGGGILALAGGIVAARQRQRYETVVLKVLGARRRALLGAFLVEYLVIGLAVALVGGALGTAAAWLVVTQVMTLPFSPAPAALAGVLALAIAAITIVGGLNLWRLIGLPAAPVLRNA